MGEHIEYPIRGTLPRLEAGRGDDERQLVGQADELNRIVDYVLEHGEGRFLISGFSGVGKSSFVDRAVTSIRSGLANPSADLARSIVVTELSAQSLADPGIIGKRLIWHLRWEVSEGRVHMRDGARDRLIQAFDGVAASSREQTAQTGREVGAKADVKSLASLGMTATHSTQTQVKSVYVPYDVQTSLLELGQLLRDIKEYRSISAAHRLRRWLPALFTPAPAPLPIVIIDRIADWNVLRELGNLFAVRGTVFMVVVPPEVRSAWRARLEMGHEDLPSFQDVYLSCMWDELPEFLETCLELRAADAAAREFYQHLVGFLTFTSAGVHRQCLEVLHRHQRIESGRRVVRFDQRDLQTIRFFDSIYRIIERRENDILSEFVSSFSEADRDQARRFVLLHARDVVARGAVPATGGSFVTRVAEALRPPGAEVIEDALLRVLVQEGVLAADAHVLSLSAAARSRVAEGRAILGTGILPRPTLTTLLPTMPDRPAAAPPPRGAPDSELVGKVIADRYHVLRKVGEGGMGRVYLAEHVKMGRRVALKVMHEAMSFDRDAVLRFQREASTAAAISHPNIATIYDFGEADNHLIYLAMEFVEGISLGRLIAGTGALPIPRAVALAQQIAAALTAAHSSQVIHRDLKPDNVLVARGADGTEQVKVVDFGIAKTAGRSANLTQTGFMVGTPDYMSPEQIAGGVLDARTDLYSLGCILYEMLTGVRPFAGSPQENLFKRLTEAAPHPRATNAAIPEALDALVVHSLAREPAQRIASATEFTIALADFQTPRLTI